MKLLLSRLHDILWRRDIEYAEFQSCTIALLWGLWLLLFQPFDSPILQAIYGYMMSYAADEVWGVMFLVLGVGQTYALIVRNQPMRAGLMLLSFAWWSSIFLMQAVQTPGTLPVPTTFMFALSSAWGFVRIATEPRRKKCGPKQLQPEAQPR